MIKALMVILAVLFLVGVAWGAEQQKAKTPADFTDQELSQVIDKTALQISNMRLQAENLQLKANTLEQALAPYQEEAKKRVKSAKVEPKKIEPKKEDKK